MILFHFYPHIAFCVLQQCMLGQVFVMLQLDSLVMKDLQVLSKDFMPSPLELTSKQRWISWVPYECLLECPKGQLGHFPIKLTMELLRALSSDDQLWLYCCHTASLFSLSCFSFQIFSLLPLIAIFLHLPFALISSSHISAYWLCL